MPIPPGSWRWKLGIIALTVEALGWWVVAAMIRWLYALEEGVWNRQKQACPHLSGLWQQVLPLCPGNSIIHGSHSLSVASPVWLWLDRGTMPSQVLSLNFCSAKETSWF